jgi:hypothetical protein
VDASPLAALLPHPADPPLEPGPWPVLAVAPRLVVPRPLPRKRSGDGPRPFTIGHAHGDRPCPAAAPAAMTAVTAGRGRRWSHRTEGFHVERARAEYGPPPEPVPSGRAGPPRAGSVLCPAPPFPRSFHVEPRPAGPCTVVPRGTAEPSGRRSPGCRRVTTQVSGRVVLGGRRISAWGASGERPRMGASEGRRALRCRYDAGTRGRGTRRTVEQQGSPPTRNDRTEHPDRSQARRPAARPSTWRSAAFRTETGHTRPSLGRQYPVTGRTKLGLAPDRRRLDPGTLGALVRSSPHIARDHGSRPCAPAPGPTPGERLRAPRATPSIGPPAHRALHTAQAHADVARPRAAGPRPPRRPRSAKPPRSPASEPDPALVSTPERPVRRTARSAPPPPPAAPGGDRPLRQRPPAQPDGRTPSASYVERTFGIREHRVAWRRPR